MYTKEHLEKFKQFCMDNFGMSGNDQLFEIDKNFGYFNSEHTRKLYLTWSMYDRVNIQFRYRVWSTDYTKEKLQQLEQENKIWSLEGYWSGKAPYTVWRMNCNCCNQLIKSAEMPLGSECPEEFKQYQGEKNV